MGIGVGPSSSRPTWTCRPRRRRHRTEQAAVAGDPKASTDTCAPPLVISAIAPAGSAPVSEASTVNEAPSSRARLSAADDTSTATTRAPSAAAIITADSPAPPQPCTASQSPGRTRPCAVTARNAVANRQPRHAAATKSTASGSATRFVSAAWTATSSAKEPGPVKPGWVWRGHTWASPAWQYSHRPQPHTNGTVTRSPARQRVTSGPVWAITPASSCPPMCGRSTGSCPFQACQSDRHTPLAPTAMTTPSGGQAGSATCASSGMIP
jgi:hypothetical protein